MCKMFAQSKLFYTVQKNVHLEDFVESFPTRMRLRDVGSIQRRTSPLKIAKVRTLIGLGSDTHRNHCYLVTRGAFAVRCQETGRLLAKVTPGGLFGAELATGHADAHLSNVDALEVGPSGKGVHLCLF